MVVPRFLEACTSTGWVARENVQRSTFSRNDITPDRIDKEISDAFTYDEGSKKYHLKTHDAATHATAASWSAGGSGLGFGANASGAGQENHSTNKSFEKNEAETFVRERGIKGSFEGKKFEAKSFELMQFKRDSDKQRTLSACSSESLPYACECISQFNVMYVGGAIAETTRRLSPKDCLFTTKIASPPLSGAFSLFFFFYYM